MLSTHCRVAYFAHIFLLHTTLFSLSDKVDGTLGAYCLHIPGTLTCLWWSLGAEKVPRKCWLDARKVFFSFPNISLHPCKILISPNSSFTFCLVQPSVWNTEIPQDELPYNPFRLQSAGDRTFLER